MIIISPLPDGVNTARHGTRAEGADCWHFGGNMWRMLRQPRRTEPVVAVTHQDKTFGALLPEERRDANAETWRLTPSPVAYIITNTMNERVRSLLSRSDMLAIVALGWLSLFYTLPLLLHVDNWVFNPDWDVVVPHKISSFLIVREFGQPPIWSPFLYGGFFEWAHPYASSLSAGFPLDILLGPILAFKIKVPLYFWWGMTGVYCLARRLSCACWPALAAAAIYMFAGEHTSQLARGQYMYLAAAWVPWVFAGLARVPRCGWNKNTLLSAGSLTMLYWEGSPYHVAFTLLAVVLVVVSGTVRRSGAGLSIRNGFLLVLLFAAGFSAIKTIPTIDLLTVSSRPVPAVKNVFEPRMILDSLLLQRSTDGYLTIDPATGDPREGFIYLGIIPPLLLLPALLLSSRRWLYFAWLLLTCLLLFGSADTRWGLPWQLLHRLPPYGNLWYTPRVVFLLYLLCAIGAAETATWLQLKRLGWCGTLLMLCAGVELLVVNRPMWERGFSLIPQFRTLPRCQQPFIQERGGFVTENDWRIVWCGHGNVDLFNDIPMPRSARAVSDADYTGEWQILAGNAAVHEVRFTPLLLTITGDFSSPCSMVINQNYCRGWRAWGGKTGAYEGRLAVQIPPGARTVRLFFLPWSLLAGVLITILTMSAALRGCYRARCARRITRC